MNTFADPNLKLAVLNALILLKRYPFPDTSQLYKRATGKTWKDSLGYKLVKPVLELLVSENIPREDLLLIRTIDWQGGSTK